MWMTRVCVYSQLLLFLPLFCFGKGNLEFIENKNQWPAQVQFAADLPGGIVFLEQDRFTYVVQEAIPHCADSECHAEGEHRSVDWMSLKAHAYQMIFEQAEMDHATQPKAMLPNYRNYFLGNDRSKWASHVAAFREVVHQEIYDCIDLHVYSEGSHLKYDLYLKSGAEPRKISIRYEGTDGLFLKDGHLHIATSLGTVQELKPYAYQWKVGKKVEVPCRYVLNGNRLGYELGSYDQSQDLIIDPTVIFATYSGSTAAAWGSTATYDSEGNAYGGGTVFNSGYPVNVGSLYGYFSGGTDVGISKFTADGTQQIYSTYLGGYQPEIANSLIADENDNLIILSTTSSNDFPLSPNAFDSSFGGGPNLNSNVMDFVAGSDIAISKLSYDGATLMASTYFGGSGTDGMNDANSLQKNYGDEARGEVIISSSGNIVIASCTSSDDIPTTAGAYQMEKGAWQDGLIASFSSDLSTLQFCTYFGGEAYDATYSIKEHEFNGDYYVVGGTSGAVPLSGGQVPNPIGGVTDGFVIRMSSDATSITGTYVGSLWYDQVYFVDIGIDGDVVVFGQTEAYNYPMTPGVWGSSGQRQFIHSYSSDLASTVFSTTFGADGGINISPTAFMVDDCDRIYAAGWAGDSESGPTNGANLYVSPNAYQTETNGRDLYFLVLAAGAEDILYATHFGSTSLSEHVDGGTSRFDPSGVIYQATCSCGSWADTPTTSEAAYPQQMNSQCDMHLLKLDMEQLIPIANASADPAGAGCADPIFTVQFENTSVGADTYIWDLGNGNVFEGETPPPIIYNEAGIYDVKLIALNTSDCASSDTMYTQIIVENPDITEASFDYSLPGACQEFLVDFVNTSTVAFDLASDYYFYWDFGDGYTSEEMSPSHEYLYPGSYSVTLVVTSLANEFCTSFTSEATVLDFSNGANTPASEQSALICQGATYTLPDGGLVTAAGLYSSTLLSVEGCDSIVLTNLAYETVEEGYTEAAFCAGSSYELPDGGVVGQPGLYSSIVPSYLGCDSTVLVDLSTNESINLSEAHVVCGSPSFTLPNGSVVTENGAYEDAYQTAQGCDSIVTHQVSFYDVYQSSHSVTVCEGQSYLLPDEQEVTQAGSYPQSFVSLFGCDSTVIYELVVLSNSSSQQSASICAGQTYALPDGQLVSQGGIYESLLSSSQGCDSLVTTSLSLNAVYEQSLPVQICAGSSYILPDGSSVMEAGEYPINLQTAAACDSLLIFELSLVAGIEITEDVSICTGQSYTLADNTQVEQEGTYEVALTSVSGCDSLIRTNLFLLDNYEVQSSVQICEGSSFDLPDGQVISEAGIYPVHLQTVAGCDSLVSYVLEVTESIETTETLSLCAGTGIELPDGQYIEQSGQYPLLFQTVLGCDSLLTYVVEFEEVSESTVQMSVCAGGGIELPDGQYVEEAGQYLLNFQTEAGCDSLVTFVVELTDVLESDEVVNICEGASYLLSDGQLVSEAGFYVVNLETTAGCDSLHRVELNLLPPSSTFEELAFCEGETYTLPDGQTISQAGDYELLLQSQSGCDSLLTIQAGLIAAIASDVQAAICEGDSFLLPDGSSVALQGEYSSVLTSASGCDSIVNTLLQYHPEYQTAVPVQLCAGQSYLLPDGTEVQDGSHEILLETVQGCDSLVSFNIQVADNIDLQDSISICQGELYVLPDGEVISEAGSYINTFVSSTDCDSTITTSLSILPVYEQVEMVEICDGETYLAPDGSMLTTSGLHTSALLSDAGCDSLIHTSILMLPVYEDLQQIDLCEGAVYTLPDGVEASNSGSYVSSLFSTAGCDSTIVTTIELSGILESTEIVDLCEGEVYTLPDGSLVDSQGAYAVLLQDIGQCDSLVHFEVSVYPQYLDVQEHLLCYNEQFELPDGSRVEESGEYAFSYSSEFGCDSIIIRSLEFERCGDCVSIPNAFSPNNDLINDFFGPIIFCDVLSLEYLVFDRWGKQVFRTRDPNSSWDGTYNGAACDLGVYVWYLVLEVEQDGLLEQINAKGNVTLIR